LLLRGQGQGSSSTNEEEEEEGEQQNIVIVCMHSLPDFTKLSNDQFELHCIDPSSLSLKPFERGINPSD
jgi:hypothetical protein